MPELRQDPITEKWVVVAPERAERPEDFAQRAEYVEEGTCPFCVGNEHLTPPEVMAYRSHKSLPNAPGWLLRVVPNLYPAFTLSGDLAPIKRGMYRSTHAVGSCEVLISSPGHGQTLVTLSDKEIRDVIRSYQERYLAYKDNPLIKYILIVHNHGKPAGASRKHPHSQLFAIPIVPSTVAEELAGSARYLRENGCCVYCDIIKQEKKTGERLVWEDDHFLAFAPYASRLPFEVWIVPKRHSANFEQITESEKVSAPRALKIVLGKLYRGLNDPPFNYYLHTAPCREDVTETYHWHVEILPRLTIAAGFELGAGMMINTVTPESAAEFLRSVETTEGKIRRVCETRL